MTAEAFAGLVGARRAGPGRWMGRCPGHDDRSPSLSIRESGDKVLIHCFAGCDTSAVLAAVGLSWGDVCGAPMTAATRRRAAAARLGREAAALAARARRRARWDRVRRWEGVVHVLGAKLARVPDDAPEGEALCRLFHQACDRLHSAEFVAERCGG